MFCTSSRSLNCLVFGDQRCSILGKATSAHWLSTDRLFQRERERSWWGWRYRDARIERYCKNIFLQQSEKRRNGCRDCFWMLQITSRGRSSLWLLSKRTNCNKIHEAKWAMCFLLASWSQKFIFDSSCIIIADFSVRCVYVCTWGYAIMISSRTQRPRETRLLMHKCADLCFYIYAHICDSFVAAFVWA